ncbi:uncharacterized protein VDAG_07133 [Verticillium dahliae VdLs.17]|uniref:Uncharacterized protein n=1 Tax=Verticillium dahliae (strain VdLs.17 / ATCC MYA-4575 / FGSC 10137) TaxID=498257 RepID=G2X9T8_VERDV|nr:uncharacterized protein VDAG_07133 [Verticillium dahliae VdLs.17]EGY15969.1 hypothetical protein VDAG_07133 [Verticillium dahliae VdLs.17]
MLKRPTCCRSHRPHPTTRSKRLGRPTRASNMNLLPQLIMTQSSLLLSTTLQSLALSTDIPISTLKRVWPRLKSPATGMSLGRHACRQQSPCGNRSVIVDGRGRPPPTYVGVVFQAQSTLDEALWGLEYGPNHQFTYGRN